MPNIDNDQYLKNQQNILLLNKIREMSIKKLRICVLAFFSAGIFSAVCAQQVNELDICLGTMRSASESHKRAEADRLQSLIRDIKTTLYLQNGQLTQEGQSTPDRIITDAVSVSLLDDHNPLYAHVELICIKLENAADMPRSLKALDMEAFKKLKYIYFLCTFEACPGDLVGGCLADKISGMTTAFESSAIKILYTYSISQ